VPPEGGPIYETALTHRSFAFEQAESIEHNERLEFLGDAILGAVVTELIFETYPSMPEGEMARLRASVVNTQALADLARSIGLGEEMRLGKGEELSGGRGKPSLLADVLEALIGAVFIDRGMPAARDALLELFRPRVAESEAQVERFDAKNALQEAVVRQRGVFPMYRTASSGPDHDKRFDAHVFIDGELYGTGTGRSKKEAEHGAARTALEQLGDSDTESARAEAGRARDEAAREEDARETAREERGSSARAS
jgi:ribonuclease-3